MTNIVGSCGKEAESKWIRGAAAASSTKNVLRSPVKKSYSKLEEGLRKLINVQNATARTFARGKDSATAVRS